MHLALRRFRPTGRRPSAAPRQRTRRLAAAAAVIAVLAGGGTAALAAAGAPEPVHREDRMMAMPVTPGSPQHVMIDTSFFTAGPPGRRPAVLLAHGFGGSKDDMAGEAEQLARHGYAVLTWSARGFGRSTGRIGLDAPDREVADVSRLIDWLGHRKDVLLDGPDDPRVGIAGASYGGAIALLAAGYDKRVDAIAPQITWWNLTDALFPQSAQGQPAGSGVFKKLWAGIFFGTGAAGVPGAGGGTAASGGGAAEAGTGGAGVRGAAGTATPSGCRFTVQLCAAYQQAAVTGRADAAITALLDRSSPSSVAARIKVPTLVVQGENDSLFPLDQGDAMARAVAANGAPVSVDWTSGGHDGGDQETARIEARVTDWFDRYLMHRPLSTGPAFRVTRSGGVNTQTGQVTELGAPAPRYPGLNGTVRRTVVLTGPPQTAANPAGGAPPAISALPGIGALSQLSALGQGLSLDFPGQYAAFDSAPLTAPLTMTGAPRVRITVSSDAQDGEAVLFAKVYDVGPDGREVLPHQLVAPLRVTGAQGGRTVTVRLPATDYRFPAGHRIRLVVAGTDLAYASPAAPAAYRIALAPGGLTVPTVPALVTAAGSVPAWVWWLPAGALAAAAALLLAGRRRGPADRIPPDPELAGVPLAISGLSKRYHGSADRYAVRELSFRVERGQVLGLLGPNGAGKTTTMRMLMGLIQPDEGEIRLFGQPVRPGAPVLSRVGAFVEGAGFLPHLSGRANLELYWRATGRPAEDAHLAEALQIADLGEALERPVRTYSQGMRQRLAIAQAMLGLPDLLILDEPTNGLDPPQIREMRAVITRYAAAGRTVIVSSHLLSEVEQSCTHLVVMDKGRLVAAGLVAEISGAAGGGRTLLVGTAGMAGPQLEKAAEALAAVPGVAAAAAADGGLLVRLDGLPVPELMAELLRLEVPVEQIAPHRRLEDAFLTLIGGPS